MPRPIAQATFDRQFSKQAKQATLLVRKLADSTYDPETWGDAFHALLWKSHTDAIVLGRKRAGDHARIHEDDHDLGLSIVDADADFLNTFIDDVKNGRYLLEDGTLNQAAINARARLYINKTRGSANEAFVNASDDDDQFEWQLGFTEHCPDCIELAAGSPYDKGTLWTHPGQGDTACLVNCACVLVRVSDGRKGFQRAF